MMTPCVQMALTIEKDMNRYSWKRKLLFESREKLRENFQVLKTSTNDETTDLEVIFLKLGISTNKKFIKLSMIKDEDYYDVIDIYDISTKLVVANRNWSKVWDLIEQELQQEPYPANKEIINKFHKVFEEVKFLCLDADSMNIKFDNFYRNTETNEIVFLPL